MFSFDPTIIIIGSLVVFFVFFFLVRMLSKGVFSGMAKKKQAQAERLMATGAKARATITSIQPTGMVVNHINIQCVVNFRLEPLSGAPAFDGTKKTLINQTQMPRIGDCWPAYYSLTDATDFVAVAPGTGSPQELAIFKEFGIENPLDDLR